MQTYRKINALTSVEPPAFQKRVKQGSQQALISRLRNLNSGEVQTFLQTHKSKLIHSFIQSICINGLLLLGILLYMRDTPVNKTEENLLGETDHKQTHNELVNYIACYELPR